jgi:hypothetical protein
MRSTASVLKLEKKTFLAVIIFVIGVFLLTILAVPPFISRAGDTFGCWYLYIQNWQVGGLAEALRKADATGRYPGYPFVLMVLQKLAHTDFLETLRITRVASLVGTFAGLCLLFARFNLSKTRSVIFGLFVALIPMIWIDIAVNSQDTIKSVFFIFSVFFTVDLLDEFDLRIPVQLSRYFFLCVCSIGLAASRGPEILPFYAFLFSYILLDGQFKLSDFVKLFAWLASPSFAFLVWIHLFGKQAVGHFGVSGPPSAPGVWLKLMIESFRESNFSFFQGLAHACKWALVCLLNKTGYVVEDFVFNRGGLRILDYNYFFKNLQRLNSVRIFLYYPTALLTIAVLVACLFRRTILPLAKALIVAAAASACFYLYGFNHYEPRYWLIAVICSVVAIMGNFGGKRVFFIFVLSAMALFELPAAYTQHGVDESIDQDTRELSAQWQSDASEACRNHMKYVLVPGLYLSFTSFRYFVGSTCSQLVLIPAEQATNINYPSRQTIQFTADYFKNSHIIGLQDGNLTF